MNPVRTMISIYRTIDFDINLSCDYLACRFQIEIMYFIDFFIIILFVQNTDIDALHCFIFSFFLFLSLQSY
jgi:hypothetical protein